MRAGPVRAGGVVLLAALLAAILAATPASRADAQSSLRGRATAVVRPTFAARLPGATFMDSPLTAESQQKLDLEQLARRADDVDDQDDQDDDGVGFWGFTTLPGTSRGRSHALPLGAQATLRRGFAFPGLGLARGLSTLHDGGDDAANGIADGLPDAAANGVAHMAPAAQLRAAGADVDASELPPGLGGTARGLADQFTTTDMSLPPVNLPGALALDVATPGAGAALASVSALASEAAIGDPTTSVNPEPATLALLATGLAACGSMARRRRG